jgi:putative lipase involved disintegration of autophagic bodies
MIKKKTIKQTALDFVKENGPSSHGEIKRVMYEYRFGRTYDAIKDRGWYTSYFSKDGNGQGAILLKGKERLIKNKETGLYHYYYDNNY